MAPNIQRRGGGDVNLGPQAKRDGGNVLSRQSAPGSPSSTIGFSRGRRTGRSGGADRHQPLAFGRIWKGHPTGFTERGKGTPGEKKADQVGQSPEVDKPAGVKKEPPGCRVGGESGPKQKKDKHLESDWCRGGREAKTPLESRKEVSSQIVRKTPNVRQDKQEFLVGNFLAPRRILLNGKSQSPLRGRGGTG